ncbi:MAG: GNAT family N-acetyltransferase [Salibacteraceae bacterium]
MEKTTIVRLSDITAPLWNSVLIMRAQAFVVEQHCCYQDADDLDVDAYHVLLQNNKNLIAYARIIVGNSHVAIGRVVVDSQHRNMGYGHMLMRSCLTWVTENFTRLPIKISAQAYLIPFYKKLRFVERGSIYLEDGIPHIEMIFEQT